MKNYQELARTFQAWINCVDAKNELWEGKHKENIEKIMKNFPQGSGIDNGSKLDYEESKEDRLVINSSYHKMDGNGYYIGWFDFKIIITPSLMFGTNVAIESKMDVYDEQYLVDLFDYFLHEECEIKKEV